MTSEPVLAVQRMTLVIQETFSPISARNFICAAAMVSWPLLLAAMRSRNSRFPVTFTTPFIDCALAEPVWTKNSFDSEQVASTTRVLVYTQVRKSFKCRPAAISFQSFGALL